MKASCMFAILCLVFAQLSGAEETVTLEQLIDEALKNNPEIQAAESIFHAAQTRPDQMRALPDPVVSFVSRNGSGNPLPFTELGEDPLSSVGIMWEQEFPYPGKLRLAGQMAELEAISVKAGIDTVRWKVIGSLKKIYFEYFKADKSIEIMNSSLSLVKQFEEIAQVRYSVGEGIQQDVLRAQVERSILEQRITSMEKDRAIAVAEINRLLNRSILSELPKPAEITLTNFDVSYETFSAQHVLQSPGIRAAAAMVERERTGMELATKQNKPDFMTSVEYANSPDFSDMWEIQIGLRIPIFSRTKQAKAVEEAKHNLKRAEKELESAQQETALNIQNEYLQIQTSAKLIKLYHQAVLPQSNFALEASLASYQVGKSDFFTTLSNFITLLEYRMNYYEELAKHETAIAKLESAVGSAVLLNLQAGGGKNHE